MPARLLPNPMANESKERATAKYKDSLGLRLLELLKSALVSSIYMLIIKSDIFSFTSLFGEEVFAM